MTLGIAGCATVKDHYVEPECEVPTLAPLPPIKSESLESVDDATYWALQTRERRLTDWALDMESQLKVLCDSTSEAE